MTVEVERKLLRWGNGYGIRLAAHEVRELGLTVGQPVRAIVQEARPSNDVAGAALFHFKGPYRIKKILEEETK
ncbi:MAG: AbrB/MazE/SpoVT family DNA-binding domain-containing protein [Thermoplasmatota archaeon]